MKLEVNLEDCFPLLRFHAKGLKPRMGAKRKWRKTDGLAAGRGGSSVQVG